jgi:tetratricopeptide (TPR) repeat protein
MTINLLGLRIFLASPGGLDPEREKTRECIREINYNHALEDGRIFVPIGWESVPRGVGRAQALIDEHVKTCDYMVLILHEQWGSSSGKYDSGTKEEFEVALECLRDENMPMKNLLILLKAVNPEKLRDPGEQLSKVLNFKEELEAGFKHFYAVFDNTEELGRELDRTLAQWLKGDQSNRTVDVSFGTVLDQSSSAPLPNIESALRTAEDLATSGSVTQAENYFAVAIANGDPQALLSYAKFLRKQGRLDRSFEINEKLLRGNVSSVASKEQLAQNADVLTNMGIIRRKQGKSILARQSLVEAVAAARSAGYENRESLAYALDNLGLVDRNLGEFEKAVVAHEEARDLHRSLGSLSGEAHSLRNLSAVAEKSGDLDKALALAESALVLLSDSQDKPTQAAVHSQMGQITKRQGELAEASEHYLRSLTLNEQIGDPVGRGLALVQLSDLDLTNGEVDQAEARAKRALGEFEEADNRQGVPSATLLLGRVELERNNLAEARVLLTKAREQYANTGNAGGEARCRKYLGDVQVASELVAETDQPESAR